MEPTRWPLVEWVLHTNLLKEKMDEILGAGGGWWVTRAGGHATPDRVEEPDPGCYSLRVRTWVCVQPRSALPCGVFRWPARPCGDAAGREPLRTGNASGNPLSWRPMPPRRRPAKDSPAKGMSRRWRIILLRSKGEILGTVEAPDVQAAKAAAAVQFDLDEFRRNRIMVQELA